MPKGGRNVYGGHSVGPKYFFSKKYPEAAADKPQVFKPNETAASVRPAGEERVGAQAHASGPRLEFTQSLNQALKILGGAFNSEHPLWKKLRGR